MRYRVLGILLILVLGSASGAFAQDDAPADEPPAEGGEEEAPKQKKEREPFVKRDGQTADNQQPGGEPTLTEVDPKSTEEKAPDEVPPEECHLDCIEAQLAKDEEREKRKKGSLARGMHARRHRQRPSQGRIRHARGWHRLRRAPLCARQEMLDLLTAATHELRSLRPACS